jgi:translation initiation factor 4G
MCELPLLSYDMLAMMIHNVYEKAIDEPSFGDMYADLCAKLSQTAKANSFIKIIESDEEPGVDGEATGESGAQKVYRWSNNVGTTDEQVVGPYSTPEDATKVALSGEDVDPTDRGEMELELHSLSIAQGIFYKIMRKKDEADVFYVVYFPVAEHKDCGQQLSKIFLSEPECMSDAVKQNSFKRSLLNKCQDEFDKQDIYVDWKREKKAYEESKSSLTEQEQAEKEAELAFRRMAIKKQMLGNIKFIGQLYKKCLLKEKIMRYCIGSLLNLKVINDDAKYPEYKDTGDLDMDEEDHEAACSMFATIGKTIDQPHAANFMRLCFTKMEVLSNHKSLAARPRFMYKDLLDLRENRWEPRREQENAKTIEEIRNDYEREERRQAQQSQQNQGGYRGANRDRRDYGSRDGRDHGDNRRDYGGSNRPRQPRPPAQTDDDGFTVIGRGSAKAPVVAPTRIATKPPPPPKQRVVTPPPTTSTKPASKREEAMPEQVEGNKPDPLSPDKLERRIKTIRMEYLEESSNVEELMVSVDELSGTPNAGMTLVSKNADRIFECKDAERDAISAMLTMLFDKGKLANDDIRNGLVDVVEFIADIVIDSPKAYEYLGDLLSAMLKIKALDVSWLCEQCEKLKSLDPDSDAPEKVVRKTMEATKQKFGVDALASCFGGKDDLQLAGLLGPDKWNAIASEML